MRLALSGELVPDAVNVQGGVIEEDVRPFIALAEKLGADVHRRWPAASPSGSTVEVRGEIAAYDVKVLELAALKGVFDGIVEEQVSYVNAPLLAAERGVAVGLVVDGDSPDHRNLITVRGTLADGRTVSVSAARRRASPRTSRSWSRSTASTSTSSRPSTWRSSATTTGRASSAPSAGSSAKHGINIAGMQVSRDIAGRPRADRADRRLRDTRRRSSTEIVEGIGAHDGRTIDL